MFARPMRVPLITALVVAASCGGSGTEAPVTIGAREDTGCPSAEVAFSHVKDTIQGPLLGELKPIAERILVEEGGLRILLQGAVLLLADADRITLERFLQGMDPRNGLGGLTKHVMEVLRYLDGTASYAPVRHDEPIIAVHTMLVSCDAAQTVTTLHRLLELEVTEDGNGTATLAGPNAGDRTWMAAVLDRADAVMDDPTLKELLDNIEIEDEDSGTLHVGKDAFQVLARLIVASIAAPDFDPVSTRQLIDEVLLSQVSDAAALEKMDALIDIIMLVTEPSANVFPHVQSLMACVNTSDDDGAIAGLVYDWLTIEELNPDVFFTDLSSSAGTTTAADLRLALLQTLAAIESNPVIARDVVRVIAKFIDRDTAPIFVRTLLSLQGQGVLSELAGMTQAIEACEP